MMLIKFVKNNIKANLLRNILVTVSVAISIMLILLVFNSGYQINDSFVEGTSEYDIVVGCKGSATAVVLNSLFFYDSPECNISYSTYENLKTDSRVSKAVPLSMGDNIKGHKIIGTNKDYFSDKITLKEGKFLEEFDVTNPVIVVGNSMAEALDIKIGDKFHGEHGIEQAAEEDESEEGHDHNHFEYTVIGILNKTGTPCDIVCFTNYEAVWEVHHHEGEENTKEITAILIKSKSFIDSQLLLTDATLKADKEIAVYSSNATLRNVLSLFSSAQNIIKIILIIVIVMAFNILFISMFTAANERQKDVAILRALGSNRAKIFISIILEGLFLSAVGTLIGLILSRLGLFIVKGIFHGIMGIEIAVFTMYPAEILIMLLSLFVSLIASAIPAIFVYKSQPINYIR